MIAILGGLGAAFMWASTILCASRSSRLIGPPSVLAWVMLVGLLVVGPAAAADGVPEALDGSSGALLAVAGVGNVSGLLLSYAALRIGKVGIVGPITSTEGAVAAVIAIVAGERLGPAAGTMLVVITAGVVLASVTPDHAIEPGERHEGRATVYALAAAAAFGASLYATGRVGEELPLAWAILPARVVGVAAVALPLVFSRRLRLTRRAAPLVLAGGLCEVAGFAFFTLGARHGLSISAVLASQFAAIAAVLAFFLFRERLVPLQVAGVTAVVAGVAALTALQA